MLGDNIANYYYTYIIFFTALCGIQALIYRILHTHSCLCFPVLCTTYVTSASTHAGLFANRINKSVESGFKLRQNHATLRHLAALQTIRGFFREPFFIFRYDLKPTLFICPVSFLASGQSVLAIQTSSSRPEEARTSPLTLTLLIQLLMLAA